MKRKFSRLATFLKVVRTIAFAKDHKEFISFSQAGEDRVISFLFSSMGIRKISYLEIGTNDPIRNNNTYYFYISGSSGVCVEPNPDLIKEIKTHRPEDVCVNAGVSPDDRAGTMPFYIFDSSDSDKGLSTFSSQQADHIRNSTSIKLSETRQIPVIGVNQILDQHFHNKPPDLVSIDVEGLDLDILKCIDFSRHRPKVFCIETVSFSVNHKKDRIDSIPAFLHTQGYVVYADTGINTIFIDESLL